MGASRGRGSLLAEVFSGIGVNAKNLDRERAQNVFVDGLRAIELRQTQVKEGNGLEEPVEGNPIEDERRPEFDDAKAGIDNPVSEELSIIRVSGGLEGSKGVITGQSDSSNVSEKLADATNVQENQDHVNAGEAAKLI